MGAVEEGDGLAHVSAGGEERAASTAAPKLTLMQALRKREHWRSLAGCAGGWFLFDITFYGNTLFAPTVLKKVFHEGSGVTPVIGDSFRDNLCLQLVVLALIGLPGYYVSVWLMDSVGRKIIQIQGFALMMITYGVLGLFMTTLKQQPAVLMVIYGLTYFFSNFGPNSTTFILPSESFPFEIRSSLNGFCAAMGKAGATLGAACFKPIVNAGGTETAFLLCALCAVFGVLLTSFCIEDRRGRGMVGDSILRLTESGNDSGRKPPTAA